MFFSYTFQLFRILVIFSLPCALEEMENSYTVYIIVNELFSKPTPGS